MRGLVRIIPALLQHILVLSIFAGFVLWNGGVVLGRLELAITLFENC